MPIPAPTSAIQAKPAPIIFAEARSIAISPEVSVKVDGVVEIETSENGENVGLQHRDQQLEEEDQHVETERQKAQNPDAGGEAAEDRKHGVASKHVGEQPDRQRERPDQVRQQLDRHQQHEQDRKS